MQKVLLGPEGLRLSDEDYARIVAQLGFFWSRWDSSTYGPQSDLGWDWHIYDLRRELGLAHGFSELAPAAQEGGTGRIRVGDYHRDRERDLVEILSVVAHPSLQAASVSVAWRAPAADPTWQWPLRIAAFEDDLAAFDLDRLLALDPASSLSSLHAVSRGASRSEILVLRGEPRAALARLLSLPYRVRAGLVVLVGSTDFSWQEAGPLFDVLGAETQAYGIVVTRPRRDDLPGLLNDFCARLSHNEPLDIALWRAVDRGTTVAALDLRIVDLAALAMVARRTARRLQLLPDDSIFSVSPLTYDRLKIAPDLSAMPTFKSFGRSLDNVVMQGVPLFDRETMGGQGLAEVASIEQMVQRELAEREEPRYLQGTPYRLEGSEAAVETRGFVVGKTYRLDVRVGGGASAGTLRVEVPFPDEEIDWQALGEVTLQVLFVEPRQWDEPLRGTLGLRRNAASTTCSLLFVPAQEGPFGGRVTLYHRGRVLQTALLRAHVVLEATALEEVAQDMSFEAEAEVYQGMRLLAQRRRFDAFVLCNHDVMRSGAMTTASARGAAVASTASLAVPLAAISALLTDAAHDSKRLAKGLGTKESADFLGELAFHGKALHDGIVLDYFRTANDLRAAEYLQIVTMEPEAIVPLEFVYEYPLPRRGAPVCKNAKDALAAGACPQTCQPTVRGAAHVCPMGFWGLRKVIERHLHDPELDKAARVRWQDPLEGRDTLSLAGSTLAGLSKQVGSRNALIDALDRRRGKDDVTHATTWDDWRKAVSERRPRLLVALPHAGGSGDQITLEIEGETIESNRIDRAYVRGEGGEPPIALLLGCDTANAGATTSYLRHVGVFRRADAALVLGTVATVLGADAAEVAARLVRTLATTAKERPATFGEVLRATKRAAVADGLMIGLALVAFGDADWNVTA